MDFAVAEDDDGKGLIASASSQTGRWPKEMSSRCKFNAVVVQVAGKM
jgi:hypothetical protein